MRTNMPILLLVLRQIITPQHHGSTPCAPLAPGDQVKDLGQLHYCIDEETARHHQGNGPEGNLRGRRHFSARPDGERVQVQPPGGEKQKPRHQETDHGHGRLAQTGREPLHQQHDGGMPVPGRTVGKSQANGQSGQEPRPFIGSGYGVTEGTEHHVSRHQEHGGQNHPAGQPVQCARNSSQDSHNLTPPTALLRTDARSATPLWGVPPVIRRHTPLSCCFRSLLQLLLVVFVRQFLNCVQNHLTVHTLLVQLGLVFIKHRSNLVFPLGGFLFAQSRYLYVFLRLRGIQGFLVQPIKEPRYRIVVHLVGHFGDRVLILSRHGIPGILVHGHEEVLDVEERSVRDVFRDIHELEALQRFIRSYHSLDHTTGLSFIHVRHGHNYRSRSQHVQCIAPGTGGRSYLQTLQVVQALHRSLHEQLPRTRGEAHEVVGVLQLFRIQCLNTLGKGLTCRYRRIPADAGKQEGFYNRKTSCIVGINRYSHVRYAFSDAFVYLRPFQQGATWITGNGDVSARGFAYCLAPRLDQVGLNGVTGGEEMGHPQLEGLVGSRLTTRVVGLRRFRTWFRA